MKNRKSLENSVETRINLTLTGEPARILLELKRRGLALSNHDCINQALLALAERILNYDIRKAELRGLENKEDKP